jgi:hypothetical protein
LKWLNDYHAETVKLVGPELKRQKKMKEYDWLIRNTKPIMKDSDVTSGATDVANSISLIFVAVIGSSFANYF